MVGHLASVAVTATATSPAWTDVAVAVATCVGVTVAAPGVWFGAQQLKLQRQETNAAFYAALGTYILEWDKPEMVDVQRKLAQLTSQELSEIVAKAYSTPPDEGATEELLTVLRVPNYFEHLGWVAEAGGLPFKAIQATLGPVIVAEWQRWQGAIAVLRQLTTSPSVYVEFERLAQRAAKAI